MDVIVQSVLWPVLLCSSLVQAQARPGSLDQAFTASLKMSGSLEHLTNATVEVIVPQNDGRILVGGTFTNVNGYARDGIVRLMPDGAVDTAFTPPRLKLGFDGPRSYWTGGRVTGLGERSDGGVVLIRSEYYNDPAQAAYFMESLKADGARDPAFTPPALYYANHLGEGFARLALLPNDSMIVGGVFLGAFSPGSPSGPDAVYDGIVGLTKTGSVDSSFVRALDQFACSLALAPDGKILVGGGFKAVGKSYRPGLARLLPNGELDTGFNPGVGSGPPFDPSAPAIVAIALQPDGKVLAGGSFSAFAGEARSGIARFNPDGSLDLTFDPGAGVTGGFRGQVDAIVVQSDGKVLIAGDFTAVNEINRPGLARLNPDGNVDLSFQPGAGPNGEVRALALEANGQILIGGDFTSYDGIPAAGLARVNGDRALFDPSIVESGFRVSIPTVQNAKYSLEAKERWDAPVWTEISAKPGDGSIQVLLDPGPLPDRRFYRVRIEQTPP